MSLNPPAPAAEESAPDFTHVTDWLFDLDNTLYPLESGLAGRMTARITDFVVDLTGLPREDAHALQKTYLHRYGLTLKGLMQHHGVDPDGYHARVHDVALDVLERDPHLAAALRRLPGRRIIFTNADARHAGRVIDALGLEDLFDEIFHIESAGFMPKPHPEAFAKILAAHDIVPARAAFFEDSEANLAPAAALGMTTVLVGVHAAQSTAPFVHHRTERLTPFLQRLRVKETPAP